MFIDTQLASSESSSVPYGTELPTSATIGDLFLLSSGALYVFSDKWVEVGAAAVSAHAGIPHLSTSNRALLNGIKVSSIELNFTRGSVEPIQPAINALRLDLTEHISSDLHLSADQKSLLSSLVVSANELNFIQGVLEPVEPRLRLATDHDLNDSKHLSNLEKSLLTSISVSAAEINTVAGLTGPIKSELSNIKDDLYEHNSDQSTHVTTAQRNLLDDLIVSASTLNLIQGISEPLSQTLSELRDESIGIEDHLNNLQAVLVSSNLSSNAHISNTEIHLTESHLAAINDIASLRQLTEEKLSKMNDAKLCSSGAMPLAGDLNLNGYCIQHLKDPVNNSDAATKSYVDSAAVGLRWTKPVSVATTENIGLTGLQTIDGIRVSTSTRVLVKNQAYSVMNGIYLASAGAWSRADDAYDSNQFKNLATYVIAGSSNGGKSFACTADILAVGISNIDFNQIGGTAAFNFGSGLNFENKTISVLLGDGLAFSPTGITLKLSSNLQIRSSLDLTDTEVIPGAYTKVVVDSKGRVRAASNPTSMHDLNITDAQQKSSVLTSISNLNSIGFIVRTEQGSRAVKILSSGQGVSIIDGDGAQGDPIIELNSTELNTPNSIVFRDRLGNFSAGAISVGSISTRVSQKLREGDDPIQLPLQKLSGLRGVVYREADTPSIRVGVDAKSVQQSFPTAVTGSDRTSISVSHEALIALLIESVKALEVQVQELKNRLA